MREILFRGKSFYDGKWVKGFIAASRENMYPNGFEMITVDGINYNELDGYIPHFTSYAVDPSTIGQYTGLKDKNGVKIFEGDIVITKTTSCKFVGCILYSTEYVRFVCVTKSKMSYPMDSKFEYEIIGNVHDNPELIRNEV